MDVRLINKMRRVGKNLNLMVQGKCGSKVKRNLGNVCHRLLLRLGSNLSRIHFAPLKG